MACPFSDGKHVFVLGTFELNRDMIGKFEAVAKACCEGVKHEHGCIKYNFHLKHSDSPLNQHVGSNDYVMVAVNQEWRSLEIFKSHLKQQYAVEFWNLLEQLSQSNMIRNQSIECFDNAKFNYTFNHGSTINNLQASINTKKSILPKCPFTRTLIIAVPTILLFGFLSSNYEIKRKQ